MRQDPSGPTSTWKITSLPQSFIHHRRQPRPAFPLRNVQGPFLIHILLWRRTGTEDAHTYPLCASLCKCIRAIWDFCTKETISILICEDSLPDFGEKMPLQPGVSRHSRIRSIIPYGAWARSHSREPLASSTRGSGMAGSTECWPDEAEKRQTRLPAKWRQ